VTLSDLAKNSLTRSTRNLSSTAEFFVMLYYIASSYYSLDHICSEPLNCTGLYSSTGIYGLPGRARMVQGHDSSPTDDVGLDVERVPARLGMSGSDWRVGSNPADVIGV